MLPSGYSTGILTSSFSTLVLSAISVLIAPGQITFTRILSGPSSTASILARATCPALLLEYADAPELEKIRVPFTEEVTITEPPRRLRCGTAYLMVVKVPTRLISRVERNSSTASSSIPAQVPLTPALATTTSSRPEVSTVVAIAERTESSSLTSQVTVIAGAPGAADRFGHFGELIRGPACQRDSGTAPGQQLRRCLPNARSATSDERNHVIHVATPLRCIGPQLDLRAGRNCLPRSDTQSCRIDSASRTDGASALPAESVVLSALLRGHCLNLLHHHAASVW